MWYAALGVAVFADPGMVRLVSEAPDYDPGQTEAKVEQWRQSASRPHDMRSVQLPQPWGVPDAPTPGRNQPHYSSASSRWCTNTSTSSPEPTVALQRAKHLQAQQAAVPVMPAFQVGDRKLAAMSC